MTDELLAKYIAGEADSAEASEVSAWIAASPENRKRHDDMKLIWDQAGEAADRGIDPQQAWERFKQRADREALRDPYPSLQQKPFAWRPYLAAAVFVLAVGVASWWAFLRDEVELIRTESGSRAVTVALADGSTVTLNKSSELVYPSSFREGARRVELTGEAFFEVAADASKPFVVRAGSAEITVIGTSFNIRSAADSTVVIVETGAVRVASASAAVDLAPGERAVAADSALIKGAQLDRLYQYYRTREFVCNDTPLPKLVEILNEAFSARIQIVNPELENLAITATFSDGSLNEILRVIGETFEIEVERQGSTIILK